MRLSSAVLLTAGTWCRERKNAVGSRKIQVGQCQLAKEERLVEDMVWEERERRGCRRRAAIHNCSIMSIRDKFTRHISN